MLAEDIAAIGSALAHPVRVRFLRALRSADGTLSPVAFAKAEGMSTSGANYHVGALRDAGVIEIVEEIPRRGATEHRYALGRGERASGADAVLGLIDGRGPGAR